MCVLMGPLVADPHLDVSSLRLGTYVPEAGAAESGYDY